ncbi:hypothetical protein Barb6_01023 [Bacteroidales bacterium Barb6]|nr:hypothetical protein Barb6_01023 [Bacteroidales bacterium Barb6]
MTEYISFFQNPLAGTVLQASHPVALHVGLKSCTLSGHPQGMPLLHADRQRYDRLGEKMLGRAILFVFQAD